MGHIGSYLWKLRQSVGTQLVLLPGAQILVLRDDGLALFQRRADTGDWEFPSGGCEPSQSFRQCAVAELREETGLIASPEALVPFGSLSEPGKHSVVYPNGDQVHAFALCFVVKEWDGRLDPEPEEVSEAGFFPLDQPPSPIHGPTLEVLRIYRKFLESGQFQAY